MNIFFTSRNFVSFENFTRIFSDERAVNSLIHSLYFTVLETPTQIIVGLLAAVALSKIPDSIVLSFDILHSSYLFIDVNCDYFSMLLDPNVGAIPFFTSRLADPSIFRDPTLAMPTVAIMTVWKNFGVTMTILLTAIQGISPSCMNLLKWMVQQIDSSF